MNLTRLAPFALLSLIAASCTTTTSTPSPTPSPGPPAQVSSANRLSPIAQVPRTIAEPVVRVGLLTDQTSARFPRIEGGYVVIAERGPSIIRRGFTVSSPVRQATTRYAVQVAALADRKRAEEFAAKISSETGERVDAVADPSGGPYRILAGDFETTDAAVPLRDRLTAARYGTDMLVTRRPSDQAFQRVHRLVDDEGDVHALESPTLLILPAQAETVTIGDLPYRGGARLFINNRGLLNVINELNVEDYVRGVVPNEMGPSIFDEVEALKAQALAARTYVIKRMGDFRTEGYDICPTPACQVYRGFSTEHALSDRAVAETTGMIITHDGQPIDALYTSTCGGETSDVEVMFPGRNEPYLRRARCVEMEMVELAGRSTSGMLTEMQTDARLFAAIAGVGEGTSWAAGDVRSAVSAASRVAGSQLSGTSSPASSRRRDVLSWLAGVWNLSDAARRLTLPEDRQYFFPGGGESDAHLVASFLIKYGLTPTQYVNASDLDAAMPREELYALLYSWLEEQGSITETSGKIFSLSGRAMRLKAAGRETSFTLPSGIPVMRRIGDRTRELDRVPIMIGDRASVLQRQDGRPVAVIVQGNYDGASFDRTSSFANWTRSYRAEQLVASIAKRNAITSLQDLRPLGHDASHRVTELQVVAEGGRTFNLRGLPIRWSLEVPDNL
ncbi:MAG TPA: SpoIID/LytB domain-containing protein, partial [Thermoanaerobaculia bacterium]|nr:SpoIID/LytB domain-containing protein [Thermoanaerobaculia bacterium]